MKVLEGKDVEVVFLERENGEQWSKEIMSVKHKLNVASTLAVQEMS